MVKKTFRVSDMHCSNCAMKIEGIEDDLPGVRRVNASYQKGLVVVEWDETLLTAEQIIAAVQQTGYTANSGLVGAAPCGCPSLKTGLGISSAQARVFFVVTVSRVGIFLRSSSRTSGAMRKASSRLGSYLPVSMALIVWRETPNLPARSACDQSRSARSTFRRVFIRTAGIAPACLPIPPTS